MRKALLGFWICLTTTLFAQETCSPGKKHSRTTARHIEAGGIGYDQGYTTLEMFLASDPQAWPVMPFLDLRGHVFDNGKMAANTGVGLRSIWGCRAYGFNAYYDYRNTEKLQYNQVGIGFETLGQWVDFRINGYLPFGKKVSAPYNTEFNEFSGHYMFLWEKHQFAMKGADAEFGFHFGKTRSFDFYAATGPYYYIGKIGSGNWGGKVRLAGMFKEYATLEVSNSYDKMFRNCFQGQLSFTLPFGGKSRVKTTDSCTSCRKADALVSRMVQPVGREEIIVVGKKKQSTVATDAAGNPLFFVFVDNMSHSSGTYESPYPTLAQAQVNSAPGNIIYVFPGNGTTAGMNAGITLRDNQKFWGSGVSHVAETAQGPVTIPAQSTSSPTITNTNVDTEGNAVTLAAHNAISGFTIASALNDAIYGTNLQSLDVSSCTFQGTATYTIEAVFPGNASISLTNNQFLDNVNGVSLTLNGTSTVVCSDNSFKRQTSVSNVPVEIAANGNTLNIRIENNIFNANTTGSIRFGPNNVVDATISLLNNTITNNTTGSQASLGSNFVIIPTGTTNNCSIALQNNTFSGNTSNALYMHTSGAFTTLGITASANTMSNNGGSALVLATPVNTLTLLATNNTITACNDNGISVIASGSTPTGNITINNNTITDIGNLSNGIAVNQNFSALNLTLLNNRITDCEGTGIISYASTGIDSLTLDVSGNTINNCENLSSNAAAGLDIEQYTNLAGSVTSNTLSGNTGLAVIISSGNASPSVCLTVSGNSSTTGYTFSPGTGTFKLTPCNIDTVNTGTIDRTGTTTVQSCPSGASCP